MENIKYIAKTNIGNIIYCIPTYNAVQKGVPLSEQIKEFKLLKVTPTKFTIEVYKWGAYEKELHIFGGMDKYNRGYIPFSSKELALKYLNHNDFLKRLRDNCRVSKLKLEQIDRIIEITGDLL